MTGKQRALARRLRTVALAALLALAVCGCMGFEVEVSCIAPEEAAEAPGLDGAVLEGKEVGPIFIRRAPDGRDYLLRAGDSGETVTARFLNLGGAVYLCEIYDDDSIEAYLARIEDGRVLLFNGETLPDYMELLTQHGFAVAEFDTSQATTHTLIDDPVRLRRFFMVLAQQNRFTDELQLRYRPS